jgi:hypothetical protein
MTTLPISLPSPTSAERISLLSADSIRRRALERLYERRDAVDSLIQSLEDYQRARVGRRKADCIAISARRKCS